TRGRGAAPGPPRAVPGDLMNHLVKAVRRGDPMIWMTGSALGMCIVMIGGLLLVILVNGLSFFWPQELEKVVLKDQSVLMGEVASREPIPNPGHDDHLKKHRVLFRLGNRDLLGSDFRWVPEEEIASREKPEDAYFVERREYGPLIAIPVSIKAGDKTLAADTAAAEGFLPALLVKARRDRRALEKIEKHEIGEINYRIEQARLERRELDFVAQKDPGRDLSAERARIEK